MRQLRVAAGALANALQEVSRVVPPPMQPPTADGVNAARSRGLSRPSDSGAYS